MAKYIEYDVALQFVYDACTECMESCEEFDGIYPDCHQCPLEGVKLKLRHTPGADVRPVPKGGIGEMSDGYHTFNGLYYQRMVLFAALVNAHKDKAWKSWKHEDGNPCFDGGWFIVGIDTPQGSYTYHYEAKDFDLFDCEELPVAKHWDGHTEKDVTRLLSLDVRPVVTCAECKWWTKQEASLQGRCELLQMYPTGAWFCANGKREES